MKNSALLLLLFGLGFIFPTTAQERQIVQGYCKDEHGQPIENVSVYAHDSMLVSVTDKQGHFMDIHAKSGEILRFAHIVFEPSAFMWYDYLLAFVMFVVVFWFCFRSPLYWNLGRKPGYEMSDQSAFGLMK